MGWSGVSNMKDLPSIWQEFQSTKNKVIHEDNLLKKVKEWSRELGYEVDNGVYLGKKKGRPNQYGYDGWWRGGNIGDDGTWMFTACVHISLQR